MNEQECTLLKKIIEEMALAQEVYGCCIKRDKLLSEVLERPEHPVDKQETNQFFDGSIPSGWRAEYFREPGSVSTVLEKLRKRISERWVAHYLEPELKGLQLSESLDAEEVSLTGMKRALGIRCHKGGMFAYREQIDDFMRQKRQQIGLSPEFRYIPPQRFAAVADIYLVAMQDSGDCTQEELAQLLGIAQSTVCKLRRQQKQISAEQEYNVLFTLYRFLLKDKGRVSRFSARNTLNLPSIRKDRLFAALYLAILMHLPFGSRKGYGEAIPSVGYLNEQLETCGYTNNRFNPDDADAFKNAPSNRQKDKNFTLYSLIRLPDGYERYAMHSAVLDRIMKMDPLHLRLLSQTPDLFFDDMLPVTDVRLRIEAYNLFSEMRKLRQPGWKHLLSEMEQIQVDCDHLCFGRRHTELITRLREFYQIMEFLASDEQYYLIYEGNRYPAERRRSVTCSMVIEMRREAEGSRPLTERQMQEYRRRFEPFIFYRPLFAVPEMSEDKSEMTVDGWFAWMDMKWNMTKEEWFVWMKIQLLWFRLGNIGQWKATLEQQLAEAQAIDRDAEPPVKEPERFPEKMPLA